MMNGLICSTVANWSMGSPKKPLTHLDFMPSQWAKQKPEVKKRVRKMKAEDVVNEFKNIFSVVTTANGKEETEKPKWVNKRG